MFGSFFLVSYVAQRGTPYSAKFFLFGSPFLAMPRFSFLQAVMLYSKIRVVTKGRPWPVVTKFHVV